MSEKQITNYQCYVNLPDNTLYQVEVTSKCNGQHCLDKVCRLLGIVAEGDYFGLQYQGNKKELIWVNMRNKLSKQMHGSPPYRLLFRVKYFVPPHQLLLQETRHQFFLNVQYNLIRDVWCENLPTELKAEFLALMAQSAFGDFNALTSMSKYPLVWTINEDEYWNSDRTSRKCSHRSSSSSNNGGSHRSSLSSTAEIEESGDLLSREVLAAIKNVSNCNESITSVSSAAPTVGGRNSPPDTHNQLDDDLFRLTRQFHHDLIGVEKSTAEYRLIKLAESKIPAYGTSYYQVRDCFSVNQLLGVGPDSIWLLTPERKLLNRYYYKNVSKISEANHVFFITVSGEPGVPPKEMGFEPVSNRAATSLYRFVTETHCFFCCDSVRTELENQTTRSVKHAFNSLIHDKGDKCNQDYVFDIRYTNRDLYDCARRQLYQTSCSIQQQSENDEVFHPMTSFLNGDMEHGHSNNLHHTTSCHSNGHHHHHHHHHHSIKHHPHLKEIGKSQSLDFELGSDETKEVDAEESNKIEKSTPETVAPDDSTKADDQVGESRNQHEKSSSPPSDRSTEKTITPPPHQPYKRSRHRTRTDSSTSDASSGSSCSVQEELNHLKSELARHEDSFLCQVCMERELARVFIPCGHLVCCAECSLQVEFCPLCRSDIERRLPVCPPWRVPMSVGSGNTSPIKEIE